MSERINFRCMKCKALVEGKFDLEDKREKEFFCDRCNEKTGEVVEKEEVNKMPGDK